MRAPRNRRLLLVQIVLAVITLGFVAWAVISEWNKFGDHRLEARPQWGYVALSGAIFLVTYAVLIATWRLILSAWSAHLPFWDAARIWCVSNLGRYVPGKVVQIAIMALMSKERGISGVAATGAAIVGTIVNIAAGIVVAVLAGWRTLDVLSKGHATLGVALLVALILGLALLPFLLPPVVTIAERLTGRSFNVGRLPPRAIAIAVAGNVIGWLMYGVAFMALVQGVLGEAPGSTSSYVAVYASTYVLGYLAFFIPGGLGVRDLALASAMPALGLATPAQAALVAVASRLWLTVLEVVPGLLFWVRLRSPRSPHTHDLADGPT